MNKDELSLVAIYNKGSRKETIKGLEEMKAWIIAGVIAAKKVSLTNKEKCAEFGSTLKNFFFFV